MSLVLDMMTVLMKFDSSCNRVRIRASEGHVEFGSV